MGIRGIQALPDQGISTSARNGAKATGLGCEAQPLRLQKLNRIAIEQMEILTSEYSRRLLGEAETN
jgi:hypothetical protein